ncbi:hypothetical protein D3C71_1696930 [compost metagenome]
MRIGIFQRPEGATTSAQNSSTGRLTSSVAGQMAPAVTLASIAHTSELVSDNVSVSQERPTCRLTRALSIAALLSIMITALQEGFQRSG